MCRIHLAWKIANDSTNPFDPEYDGHGLPYPKRTPMSQYYLEMPGKAEASNSRKAWANGDGWLRQHLNNWRAIIITVSSHNAQKQT